MLFNILCILAKRDAIQENTFERGITRFSYINKRSLIIEN